jgi:adenylylsulfate kinase-like enzyme
MIIWLIGMSASGKTTIAREMIQFLRQSHGERSWVLLDGDAFRTVMGEDLGHDIEGRRKNAQRLSRLCAFLDSQDVNVLACVLSIFHETQDWLRDNISDYRQIYLKVDYEILKRRDNKQLYEKAENGAIDNVVGVQIPFPEPKKSDFILDNNDEDVSAVDLARKAMKGLGFDGDKNIYRYTEHDLLSAPITYQYLPFEGEPFLRSYRDNREKALSAIERKMLDFEKCSFMNVSGNSDHRDIELAGFLLETDVIGSTVHKGFWKSLLARELMPEGYRKRFFKNQNLENIVVTREYLVSELKGFADCSWNYALKHKHVFRLLQRFEVSKKILICYSLPDFRKIEDNFSDFLNFPLFHCLLVAVHGESGKRDSLALQNGFLKLGDILVSTIERLVTPAQMILAYVCIQNELNIMGECYHV